MSPLLGSAAGGKPPLQPPVGRGHMLEGMGLYTVWLRYEEPGVPGRFGIAASQLPAVDAAVTPTAPTNTNIKGIHTLQTPKKNHFS